MSIPIKTLITILFLLTINVYAETEICSSTTPTIPNNNATGITDTINISDAGNITDLKITLDISHDKVSELNVNLTHDATNINLLDYPGAIDAADTADEGCEGKNIPNLTIADNGTKSLENDCTLKEPAYSSGVVYTPNDFLASFDGKDITGNWVLKVSDNNTYNNADGTLNSWCIKYNRESSVTLNPEPPFAALTFGGVDIGKSGDTPATLTGTGDKIIIYSADFTGANTSEFTLTSHNINTAFEMEIVPVPPGNATVTFTIECTPTQLGTRTANFNLYTNIPAYPTLTYPLTCEAKGGAYSDNGTSPISFGLVEVTKPTGTTSSEHTFDITAGAGADLTLSYTKTGSHRNDFSITQFPSSPLTVGNTGTVGVTCTPKAVGNRTGKLKITTNDPANDRITYNLKCTGEGVTFNSTPVDEGDELEFGSAKPGEGGTSRNLNIGNSGNLSLSIDDIQITGTDAGLFSFSPAATALTLGIGINYDIDIACNPATLGDFSATLEISHNDTSGLLPNPLTYDLACSGTDQDAEPLYYSIPAPSNTINVGSAVAANSAISGSTTTATSNLNVKERGNADLIINSYTITGTNASEFTINNSTTFPVTIPDTPDDTGIDITIECSPPVEGLRTAILTFATNDPTNFPAPSYNLECTGLVAGYDSTPEHPGETINVGSQPIYDTITYNLTVEEIDNAKLLVDLATPAITGTYASNFSLNTSFPFTVNSGGNTTVKIQCTPSFIGLHDDTALHFVTNDPDQPTIDYDLECTGMEAIGPGYSSTPKSPGETVDFGTTPMLVKANEQTLTIKEVGTTKLNLDSISIGGTNSSDFNIESITQSGNSKPFPSFIGDGDADFEIVISCTPSAEGTRTATLDLTTNDTNNSSPSYDLTCLSGPPLIPVYTSNPAINSTIDFGSVLESSTVLTKTITITEDGNTDLEITNATLTGDSEITLISPTSPITIADGGSSETITLQCSPTSAETYTAQLEIATNDPNNLTVTHNITCTGTLPPQNGEVTVPLPSELTLTVKFAGDGNGKFNGMDCKTEPCSQLHETASTVQLAVTPDSDSIFERWSGNSDCSDAEVFMVKNITCTAYFKLKNPPVVETPVVETPVIKPTCTQATEILYVNHAASGYDSGLNWQDAFTDLQDALDAARNNCPNIKQIWIAKGTYYPTADNDRTVSFDLVNGIKIYGGFTGHESQLEDQNCSANLTILSGNIGIKNDNSDNSQHVITATGVGRNTLLNCLTIIDGYADECGGGMFNDHASPTLKYMSFSSNHAEYGAGLCNINNSKPLICQVFIQTNTAIHGAGIANFESAPVLKQANITDNNAAKSGGGMFNSASNPLISHSIISKNNAEQGAGMVNFDSSPLIGHLVLTSNSSEAMLNENSSPSITQSTVAFNQSGIVNYSSSAKINNSILWDTTPIINEKNSMAIVNYSIVRNGWDGNWNRASDPLFTKNINNLLPTMADNVHLQPQSPAIDAGNNDLVPQYLANSECDVFVNNTAVDLDFDGKNRVSDGNADGVQTVDMGVHEASFSFTHSLTVELTGEGSGSVVSNNPGINCGNDCYHNYSSGIDVLLTAKADQNSVFNGWSGDCGNNGYVKMTGFKRCQAQFDLLLNTEDSYLPESEDRTCSTGNVINTTCNFGWDDAEDILIEEKGNVSNMIIKSDIKNNGRIANSEITKGKKVTGGILSGYIDNKGILADFEFLGAEIRGGKLVGNIVNNSDDTVDGIIIDVSLAPNTRITGGRLGGRIIGNSIVPAILEDLVITDGTYLTNVIIGNNVTSVGEVEYGPGIQFYFGTKSVPFEKTIVNEGTIKDLTFRGKNLSGGTLDGDINITMGGTVINVELTAGTKINGGNVKGKVIGDAKKPAILTNLSVVAGSYLENVIISEGVYLPDDVELGPNVTKIEEPVEEVEDLPTAFLIDEYLGVYDLFDASFITNIKTGKVTHPNHAMLTFEQVKKLKLSTNIKVLPDDKGKSADMLVVVEHKDRKNPDRNSIKMLEPPKWNSWDNDIFSLKPMQHYKKLPLSFKLPVYTGDLNDIAEKISFMSNGHKLFLSDTSGEYNFYIGYRLPDQSIVYNGPEPLHFFVETAPESCILYALHDDKLNDSQVVVIDLSAGLKGSMKPLGPMRPGRDMEGLALHPDDPDLLFASAGNHAEVDGEELDGYLYTIHRETGDMKVIGPTGFEKTAGLAFNPVDRTLWAWGRNEGGSDKWRGDGSNWERDNDIVTDKWSGLIKIDIETGKGTPVKQLDYNLHDMGGLAWSFEGDKLYASGDDHLWVYDLATQSFEVACDFVDHGRIEGLDTQPNGFLLVGVDRKGKNGRETRILAYDPVECKIIHKRVYKGLQYDDIESIVWPATECNDTSWLSDH
ncbi:choice-of-anchor D domain-containing protein [Candidatus Halobeggiatoa sp. HSG11]|nr:choice-of-anchor D domain-containing protein [Candidatus Halobeggiatoa sp. HSG11]